MTIEQIKRQIKILVDAVTNPTYCFRPGERELIWEEIRRLKKEFDNLNDRNE